LAVLNKIATECWDYRSATAPSDDHPAIKRALSMITKHALFAVAYQLDPSFNWERFFLSGMYLKVSFIFCFFVFLYVVFA